MYPPASIQRNEGARRYSPMTGVSDKKGEKALEGSHNISLNLTKAEYSFIMSMSGQCAGKGVSEVSTDTILRSMVRLLQRLEVDVSGIDTEDQLLNRLQNAMR